MSKMTLKERIDSLAEGFVSFLAFLFVCQGLYFWGCGVNYFWKKGDIFYAAVSVVVPPIGYIAGLFA